MSDRPPASPRAELADLVARTRGLAELDRLLGVDATPVPALAPLAPSPAQSPPDAGQPSSPGSARAPASVPAGGEGGEAEDDLAARRARNEAALHALARRYAACTSCPLHAGRTHLVFGQGDAAAEVVFVGEGPGYHEDQQGLAFVGRAGELLTKMIRAMGIEREEAFIGNVVKCRPPGNRAPTPDEMGTCLPILREQLQIIRPRVICALGKTAAVGLGLIAPDASLGRSRGRLREWEGIPAMLTYHPAYLLRKPQDKRKTWADLQQMFPLIERRRPGPLP